LLNLLIYLLTFLLIISRRNRCYTTEYRGILSLLVPWRKTVPPNTTLQLHYIVDVDVEEIRAQTNCLYARS